jgi:hypothetical protein
MSVTCVDTYLGLGTHPIDCRVGLSDRELQLTTRPGILNSAIQVGERDEISLGPSPASLHLGMNLLVSSHDL